MFDSSLLPLDLYRVPVRCYVLIKTMYDSSLLPLDLYRVHVRCYVLAKTMFDSWTLNKSNDIKDESSIVLVST
jgi:hypothetical protein